MDTKTGKMYAHTVVNTQMRDRLGAALEELEGDLKARGKEVDLAPIPDEYAGAFRKRGPSMSGQGERVQAAKSARRKSNKMARKSRRKNRKS